MIYYIKPVPKPRMTRSDKWKKRDAVLRYHAFCDSVRAENIELYSGDDVTFVVPFPKSYSKKKMRQLDGEPHLQTPDLDNLIKALLDALYDDDSHIWELTARKIWGYTGQIIVAKT